MHLPLVSRASVNSMPKRPLIKNPVPWPNGARCAVCFSWDLDADSILHIAYPDRADTFLSTQSLLRYGPTVAVDRICGTFADFDLKQTFFIPGWCMERYPGAVETILEGGHEIGHHGYLHESPNRQSAEDERYWLERALGCFDKYVGRRPKGYRAPLNEFSKHSLAGLLAEGFEYDSSLMGDDLPYLLEGETGRMIELPQYIATDDWPQFMHSWDLDFQMPIAAPNRAKELYLSEFDAAWDSGGGLWMTVWHPFLAGRPARIKMMIEMIEYMQAKGGVWFATLAEISGHVRSLLASGQWQPRIDRLPYDVSPIPELTKTPLPQRARRAGARGA